MPEIELTKGRKCLVDTEDYEVLAGYKWCVTGTGYVHNRTLGRIHRAIMRAPKGVLVDHINGDKLDNRRSNLRFATKSQNNMNTKVSRGVSKFKGVFWVKRKNGGMWKARLTVDGKGVYLGSYKTDVEAAKAYNDAACKYFGEFSHLNDLTLPKSDLIGAERGQIDRKNPHGFNGVTYNKRDKRWVAQLIHKNARVLNKSFATAEEAARAYDEKAASIFGDKAVLNFQMIKEPDHG